MRRSSLLLCWQSWVTCTTFLVALFTACPPGAELFGQDKSSPKEGTPAARQFRAGAAASNITPQLGTNRVETEASVKIVDALMELLGLLK